MYNAIQFALELLNALAGATKDGGLESAHTNGVAVLKQCLHQKRNPTVVEWNSLRAAITTAPPLPQTDEVLASTEEDKDSTSEELVTTVKLLKSV